VLTTGSQPWEGAIGSVVSSGSEDGIMQSSFDVAHNIYSVSVQGPWQQQPGGEWAQTGNVESSMVRAGGLGSVSVSGGMNDSNFDVEGGVDWMGVGGPMRRTNVDAGTLNAVSVGALGQEGGTVECHMTDETDDWWLGIDGVWERVEGTKDYWDNPAG
jgi:hypothetical protein